VIDAQLSQDAGETGADPAKGPAGIVYASCVHAVRAARHRAMESLVVRRLLALPAPELDALRRAVEAAERDRGLLHRARAGARPTAHPIALSPLVLPARVLPTLRRLAEAFHRFQARAPELYRTGALNFRRICPLEPAAEAWFLRCYRGADPWELLLRLDVGLAPGGRICVFETNATALAGLFNHTAGVEILSQIVLPRILSATERRRLVNPPDLLAMVFDWVAEARRRLGIRPPEGGIAFVESASSGAGFSEVPAIARHFSARGAPASCGSPSGLRLSRNGVRLGRLEVDIVYRDMGFADMAHPARSGGRLAGLIRLLERRAALPGFSGEFDHKGILEALTSPAYRRFFRPAETHLLRRCVPWTRVLWARSTESPSGSEVDLPRYASTCKDQLVIKPNRGCGGEAVMLGRETQPARWRRAIERALAEPGRWVVQEWFDAQRRPMVYLRGGAIHSAPCFFSLGLFHVPGRLGLHGRISPDPVVNVARDGALACVFLAAKGSAAR
jgi:hypothetical protein